MAAPERRLSEGRPAGDKRREAPKRSTPLGTDPALTVPAARGEPLPLTFWDLWFALVAAKDCGGDLGRLAERLAEERTVLSFGRESAERKLSHLRGLQK